MVVEETMSSKRSNREITNPSVTEMGCDARVGCDGRTACPWSHNWNRDLQQEGIEHDFRRQQEGIEHDFWHLTKNFVS